MSLTVRPASAADWEAIAALLDQHRLPLAGARDHVTDFLVAVQDATRRRRRRPGDDTATRRCCGPWLCRRQVAVSARDWCEALLEHAHQAGVGNVVLLTTTAAAFFPRFGFTVVTREDVPAAVHASAEFQGACPASATVMRLVLRREELT